MQKAGIDTSVFTPHLTRAAASSRALESNVVPLKTIVKTAAWKRISTFAAYYNKSIHKEGVWGQVVLAKGRSL